MVELENKDLEEAWDRVARTPDGLIIYRHLQRIRLGLAPDNAPDSALPLLEGRRSLAAYLMAFMTEGIGVNDRACITFAVAKPVDTRSAQRGAGRRIGPEHFIPGYDTEPGTSGSSGANGSGTGGADST
jgi:hypothetical protein